MHRKSAAWAVTLLAALSLAVFTLSAFCFAYTHRMDHWADGAWIVMSIVSTIFSVVTVFGACALWGDVMAATEGA